jgi:hypothetical protein
MTEEAVTPVHPEFLKERYAATKNEMAWRGLQRDAMVPLTFLVCGAVLPLGTWAMFGVVPIYFLGSIWLHHDRRIGRLAQYLRREIEPRMEAQDGVGGLEDFLDSVEDARSHRRRFHFTSINSRLFFPTFQAATLVSGLTYAVTHARTHVPLTLVEIVALLAAGIIALTTIKVRHVRAR